LPDEAELLERIRQFDTSALAQVYDDFYDRIYRYIYGYLGQANAAEDLTANVFFRLLRAVRNGHSPRSNLSAWLYRVAHNLVVDAFRRSPPEELELADWLESGEPDPSHTVETRMQLERVRVALRELTDGQQQVIVLKFFQGMDSREVASIIGRSEGAVDALQHRGLCALRNVLHQTAGPGAKGGSAHDGIGRNDPRDKGRDSPSSMITMQRLSCLLEVLLATIVHAGVAARLVKQTRAQRRDGAGLARGSLGWQRT
jgi:RNA polymerase sigma-70 factor (ECF subfamily)